MACGPVPHGYDLPDGASSRRILQPPNTLRDNAMNIDAPETIKVSQTRVSCDGGGGALGHPKVWYTIGPEGFVECGYCDRRFVLESGPADKPADG